MQYASSKAPPFSALALEFARVLQNHAEKSGFPNLPGSHGKGVNKHMPWSLTGSVVKKR